jgi:hypothetical protein
VLERAVQGVARYQELEMVRLAEIREWARTKSQAGGEGPPELEHERAVVEPHGVP